MAQKRGLGLGAEGVNDNPEFQETQQRNRRFKFTKCLIDVESLENMFRKVVREETDQAFLRYLQSNPRSLPNDAELPKFRKFKLHLEGQLPHRLYTYNAVEAEGPLPVKVVLLDVQSGRVITDGPLSSAKVEILALHGDFKAELLENWTQKEFNGNVLPARDGKRPLLNGQCVIALSNGSGFINGVCFTDNSSWVRSKKFRLGVKIGQNMANEDQVREAVSSPFEVKDRRGENYQKHSIPSLEDEVWRLKGIGKDGKICQRLADHQIYKVKDLLQHYHIDQSFLRSVLGVSPKNWETIFQQAMCFSSNVYKSLGDLAPNDICTEPMTSNILPFPHLHHFSAPVANQDQPEIQMSYAYGLETSHELDESMAVIQDTVIDNMAGLCNAGQNPTLGYNMAPSPPYCFPAYEQSMINFSNSNWISITPSIGEEGGGLFMGSNGNSSIQILSSIHDMGACTSEPAGTKAGWSKLRSKWRILVKYDDAKGKFPCN